MLIPCERHTAPDLDLWADYAAMDAANARRPNLSRKIAESIEVIKSFAARETGEVYAGTSWGKDSVVLIHLILSAGLRIPLWNLRSLSTRNPYCDAVRDTFLHRFAPLAYREQIVDYRRVESVQQIGFEEWEKQTYKIWDAAWAEINQKSGRHYFSGIRIDESSARAMRFFIHGFASKYTCAPLSKWTTNEIFAYLALHDLPIHPNYAMLGGGRYDRLHIRVAEIGDYKGTERGRREWEREYYPEYLLF